MMAYLELVMTHWLVVGGRWVENKSTWLSCRRAGCCQREAGMDNVRAHTWRMCVLTANGARADWTTEKRVETVM